MNTWKGHFSRPSNLRWRSPQRSTIDPPVCRRYWFSHCLPNIATNAARSDIKRRIQEARGCYDLREGVSHAEGRGVFVGSDGTVETEKSRTKIGCRAFVGVRFKPRLDIDDES